MTKDIPHVEKFCLGRLPLSPASVRPTSWGRKSFLGTLASVAVLGAALFFGVSVFAQANAVIHIFNNPAVEGRTPVSALVQDADGVLYGLTSQGGSSDRGTVYKIRPDGTGYGVLHSFSANPGRESYLNGKNNSWILGSDGVLYGTSRFGGANGGGYIFKINRDGSGFTLIHSFEGNRLGPTTGYYPDGGFLMAGDGFLYGCASVGSPTAPGGAIGGGVVYKIATDGTGYRVLASFNRTNVFTPTSLIQGRDGKLYGTTFEGSPTGSINPRGAIFTLTTDGTGFAIVYNFTGTGDSGSYPDSPLVHATDGRLYGTALEGGTSRRGSVYRINTDGTGFAVVHTFSGSPPVERGPADVFFQGSDGAFYGTARGSSSGNGFGRAYSVRPDGSGFRMFTAAELLPSSSRGFLSLMQGRDGAFYFTVPRASQVADTDRLVRVTGLAGPAPGGLINLSVRTDAGTGSETLIVGFAVRGDGGKRVLVRGIGPTLTDFGVGGALANPQLGLFGSAPTAIAGNDNWGGGATLSGAFTQVGAFPLPTASADAALLQTVASGSYSAQVTSASGGSGVALVEVYDADPPASSTRLVNLSARSVAGTGAQTLIAGFVISGETPRTLLIRGIGPGLAQFGLTGVLANPRLELHTTINGQDTILSSAASWNNSPTLAAAFAQVGAFTLPTGSADSAMLITLTPGTYTAQLNGANNTTGVALVEIYQID